MTELSKKILASYQIRKTKKQKTEFISFLQKELGEENVRVEKSGHFGSRNIVLGDPLSAKVIFTAHYDTQPVLPFPNFLTPKNLPPYLAYSFLVMLGCMLLFFGVGVLFGILNLPSPVAFLLSEGLLLALLCLILFGPANRHTANDNTSGVITVLEAYQKEAIRNKAAFILFDHEEMGLLGSSAYAKAHRGELADKLVINFDCVGDGDNLMLILSAAAEDQRENLRGAFAGDGEKQVLLEKAKGTLYPSDQLCFKRSVGVAAFRRHPKIGLYISRIHTKNDTICEEKNITLLLEGAERYMAGIN